MALSITPAVDQWLRQTDAFSIIFRAYDDNGERCRHNQMAIKYSITYDGTMPSLTNMETLYGDASGLIALVITKPCVISLYGQYTRDVNDLSTMITQEIAINYEITFQPVIMSITASYDGPNVPITDNYDTKYLSIKAHMSDGSLKNISPNDCDITNLKITEVGPNTMSFNYMDTVLDVLWPLSVIINGIPKLLSLEADYIGERRLTGERVYPSEVSVKGLFLTTVTTTERLEIKEDDWYFVDIPIITEDNKGIFLIKHQHLTDTITVPYDINSSLRLNVWYEGAKIEVGNKYDPNNVVIYLVYPDGEKRRISRDRCTFDSFVVTKEGWNWFKVTYMQEYQRITQEFIVEGIIRKDYIDLDFKVLYIKDLTSNREEDQMDLTKEFTDEIMFEDCLIISWTEFLRVVNKSGRYGLYIVTVPKLSGLSNQYDMDWEVLCIDETTLKATIKKIYNEEE